MGLRKKTEARLKRAYYQLKTPEGLGGLTALAKAAGVSEKTAHKWLKGQRTYTLHRSARKRYPTRKYFVNKIDEQWQADLAEMQRVSQTNQGYRYILTVIDILSRYAWTRKLHSKNGLEVSQAFKSILVKGRVPIRLQTDQGKEFDNKYMSTLYRIYNIEHFTVKSPFKAAIVERLNRTLKEKIYKYFTAYNTTRWIDILPSVTNQYNNRKHRTIGCSPASVNLDNYMKIWRKLYASRPQPKIRKDVQLGDRVRISRAKSIFEKGYLPKWTEEEFIIDKISTKFSPIMFSLRDLAGNLIEGKFYRQEIQPIISSKNYLVEKIIKQKKIGRTTWYLVHWLGYPNSMDSWVRKSDIIKSPQYK